MNESYDLTDETRSDLEKRGLDLVEFPRKDQKKICGVFHFVLNEGTPEEFAASVLRHAERVREGEGAEVRIEFVLDNPRPRAWGTDPINDFSFVTSAPETDEEMGKRAIDEYDDADWKRKQEEKWVQATIGEIERKTGKKVVLVEESS
jgi:hypothetical protein